MAKSLSTDWETQLRQIGRTQFRTAKQIRTWLGRLDLASPATRRRMPAPGDTAPGDLPGTWQSLKLSLAPLPGELVPQLRPAGASVLSTRLTSRSRSRLA